MKRFEYKIREYPNSASKRSEMFMNDLGEKGWEIFHIITTAESEILYAKREKYEMLFESDSIEMKEL